METDAVTHGDENLESIIVLDDFVADPWEVRNHALSAEYESTVPDAYYPGRNSVGRFNFPWLADYISNLVGEPLIPGDHTSHGSFRLCLEGEIGHGGVHVDPCHWSCILYLSLDAHCKGGTDFFRHRPTNSKRAPILPHEYEALGVTRGDVYPDTLWPRCVDPAIWEPVDHVPMAFNRLVVFRPWLWHNAGPGFGTSVENGRLIHVGFFVRADSV